MSFSSGSFTLVAGNPVVTGTTISSTTHNNTESDIATGLTTCLLKDGTQTVTANIPMSSYKFTGLAAGSAAGDSLRYEQLFTTSAVAMLGAMNWVEGANIASAATINLTTATGNAVHVTGTTQIDAVTLGDGMWRLVIFDGALTLTHHATNNNLPGSANITTAANDRASYWSDGTTVYCMFYQRASGGIITAATQAEQETATSLLMPVTPGRQQFHPSALKFWGKCGVAGDLASPSYNITSVGDTAAGQVTVTIATDFSTGNYSIAPSTLDADSVNRYSYISSTTGQGQGSFLINCTIGGSGVLQDPAVGYYFMGAGDQ